jgi:hypothetical protein
MGSGGNQEEGPSERKQIKEHKGLKVICSVRPVICLSSMFCPPNYEVKYFAPPQSPCHDVLPHAVKVQKQQSQVTKDWNLIK